MTTNATQLIVDLTTLIWAYREPDDLVKARHRISVMFPCVVGFVVGCAAGAALEVYCGLGALALPVLLAAIAVPLGELRGDGPAVTARRINMAGEHVASDSIQSLNRPLRVTGSDS